MLRLVVLLLASGCITLSSCIQREYHLITQVKNWGKAQSYCREKYHDLATIDNLDNMNKLINMAKGKGAISVWIGLRKVKVASWLWAVGETHGFAEYANWATGSPEPSENCGGIRSDGKWLSALCGQVHPFVCQENGGSGGMYVVLEKKSWKKARKHCQLRNGDLASAKTQTENQALQQIVGPTLTFAWIGLFRDQWKWSDNSDTSFRHWDASQPNNDGSCALLQSNSKAFFDRSCATTLPFFCYNVKKVMLFVRVEMKSNAFFNFTDPAMSEAILNEIQKKYKVAELRWKVHTDGKIFHKKEKKKIN